MVGGTFLALKILPELFEVNPISASMGQFIFAGIVICLAVIILLDLVRRRLAGSARFQKKTAR